jgi:hypothetical protein
VSCSSNGFSTTAAQRGFATAVLPGVRVLVSASALWLAACSGSTDVVGVLDPDVSDVATARGSDPGSDPGSEKPEDTVAALTPAGAGAQDSDVLLVAGMPLPDWPGPTSQWPLDTSLRSFFSDSADVFSDSFSGSGDPSRDGAPEQAQREAFERMDVFSGEARHELRFAASTGVAAERLRELFASVESVQDEPPSLVARDSWDDRYLVAVPTDRCDRSGRRGGCSAAFSGPGFSGAGASEPEHRP